MEDGHRLTARRILVLGKSGSGKSTLSRELSSILGIKHVEIDAIFWRPNWQQTPKGVMQTILDRELDPAGEWIADGNFRAFADITWRRAELIVWLDYPVVPVLWRLLLRSAWRIWTRQQVCGENYENGWGILWPSHEHNVLLACLYQRRNHAREYPRMIKEYGEDKVMVFQDERTCQAWVEKVRQRGQEQQQEQPS
ncbi:uncharacterized protein PV09_00925 [Verruconis gallopava]|uniref:Adenylate kinase n=1 Tax=Verruconis gallopava TaxID=253628 RepID=A0A0D1Z7X3_9PEZI|nr:uncharacterized protein PV09_00925 [Verruconis gallopava]KIW09032.1 hypothetical protein PV09_00925 [Verruconis gallopava]